LSYIGAGTSAGHVTRSKRIEIMLEMRSTGATRHDDVSGCAGFGLVLCAGANHSPDQRRPITVSRVIPLSPADRSPAVV